MCHVPDTAATCWGRLTTARKLDSNHNASQFSSSSAHWPKRLLLLNLGAFAVGTQRHSAFEASLASGRAEACVHANHRIRKGCRPCVYLAHADGEPRIPLLSSHNLTRASSTGSTKRHAPPTAEHAIAGSLRRIPDIAMSLRTQSRPDQFIIRTSGRPMAPNDTRALTNSRLPGRIGARRSLQHVRTGSDFGLVWSGADSIERTAIETTNPPVCA